MGDLDWGSILFYFLFLFFAYRYPLAPAARVKRWSFLYWVTLCFCQKSVGRVCAGLFTGLILFPSIRPLRYPAVLITVGHHKSSNQADWFFPLCFFNIVLGSRIPLSFCINFRIIWSTSINILAEILIGIVLNLYQFRGNWYVTYIVFEFLNMICLSIYVDFLWFISSGML